MDGKEAFIIHPPDRGEGVRVVEPSRRRYARDDAASFIAVTGPVRKLIRPEIARISSPADVAAGFGGQIAAASVSGPR